MRSSALALLALLAWSPALVSAQTLNMSVSGDAVRIRAPGWSFLDAESLARLKDGRSVRVEVVMMALAAPGRAPSATVRRVCSLSYDLWEERFAVAVAGAGAASISHLTSAAAEAWCVEQMAMPIASLRTLNDLRFWIRLECRILDGDGAPDPDEGAGLTLERIIDALSRRKRHEPPARAIDGGPFRLPTR